MPTTTSNPSESFIFSESPALTGQCAVCRKSVKQSIDDADNPIQLEIGYKIRTIKIHPGGRTFERVSSDYLHVCQQPLTETQQNSFRGASLGEPALR